MGLVEVTRYEGWTELVLNRSEQRNALSSDLADAFVESFEKASSWGPATVLSARGPVFCAGADLKEGMSLSAMRPSSRILTAITNGETFVISAVQGGVYGAGIALLAASSVVVADARAKLGLPESRHGLFPLGVVPWLERSVPPRRLLELGMHAGDMTAEEALRYGLLTELVDENAVSGRARWWAERAVDQPEVARQAHKWWVSSLTGSAHEERIRYLEGLLSGHLPASDPGESP